MSHNWQNILVAPTATIRQVLQIIDKEALQLAIVVDQDNRLLGTVTDGDIRRGLIKGKSLSAEVAEIMFITPTVVTLGTSRHHVLDLMKSKSLLSLPIISEGIVVGLETINTASQKSSYDNPVFIMAGGFGTRLKPLTDNCPKPMLKVGDKPILETVILSFIKSGFRDFYISTHFLPEIIREHFGNGSKWNVTITYVHESQPLGTGGALGLLPAGLPDLPIILMNGDVLTKIDFEKVLKFHNDNQGTVTMCVREYEYQVPFGVVESEGHKISSIVEKPVQRFHVNAGIYIISKDIVDSVEKNKPIDMPTLIENNLDTNALVYPFYDYWLDIGRMDEFKKAQSDIQTLGLLND
jgi:dTDP-glucose pyrophosphorylase/predicted transcriptional regulator